jgi:hypothetical protein
MSGSLFAISNWKGRITMHHGGKMIQLIQLVMELQKSDEYNSFLEKRVVEMLEQLCKFVKSDSQTAKVFKEASTFTEIICAAQEDAIIYDAGVYYAIAALASAFRNACWKWNGNNRTIPIFYNTKPQINQRISVSRLAVSLI